MYLTSGLVTEMHKRCNKYSHRSVRAIQLIPTQKVLDGFQTYLDESSLGKKGSTLMLLVANLANTK